MCGLRQGLVIVDLLNGLSTRRSRIKFLGCLSVEFFRVRLVAAVVYHIESRFGISDLMHISTLVQKPYFCHSVAGHNYPSAFGPTPLSTWPQAVYSKFRTFL